MRVTLRSLTLVALLLSLSAVQAYATDGKTRITQLGHTAWRVQDGLIQAAPNVIVQSKDGYLWIGTETGLLRFDGVRFVPFTPVNWDQLGDSKVTALFAASDGTLWIGTPRMLASWKDGRLTPISVRGYVNSIAEDRQGRIWTAVSRSPDHKPLCQVSGAKARCFGAPDGVPFPFAGGLSVDDSGTLVVASAFEVARWSPERGLQSDYVFEDLRHGEGLHGISSVFVDSDGAALISIGFAGKGLGLQRLKDGTVSTFRAPGLDGSSLEVQTAYRDKAGSLWIGTFSDGMYRVTASSTEHFTSKEGLSGDSVRDFREDREGNLWVSTDGGIDSFHDLKVISWTNHEGLPSGFVSSVLAARDGSILIGTHSALNVMRDGITTTIGEAEGLPGRGVTALLEGQSGQYWMGVSNQLVVYDGHHFTIVKRADGQPTGVIVALALDADGSIWASTLGPPRAVLHIHDGKVESVLPEAYSNVLSSDPQSGFWVARKAGVLHALLGHMQSVPLPLKTGMVGVLLTAPDGSLLAASSEGVWGVRDGKAQRLGIANGLPCEASNGLSFSAHQDLVIRTQCGLIEIAPEALAKWWSNKDARVPFHLIDTFDGARLSNATFSPQMSRAPDGRIWIANEGGIQVFDPDHLAMNGIAPPVHIEDLVADRIHQIPASGLALAPLTRDVEIQYTALSFSMPQKVRFKYMLEGRDTAWQDPGTRRSAFYQDLAPGRYRFRVIAANNDGLWNEDGDSFEFSVRPAWFQTRWFRALWIACLFALIWAIYKIRVTYIAKAIGARFNERLAERTRVARQLHDTFLQTVQGSKMIADDALVSGADQARMRTALVKLSAWLEQATREGREALHSLRVSTVETNHLTESLRQAAASIPGSTQMSIEINATGEPRNIHPIVRDEVFQIAFEAIRNAIQHSQASAVRVEILYASDFTLKVQDDGIGLDPTLALSGRSGHFGLTGMRERASRVRGKLQIAGGPNGGTEVVLAISGSIAYRTERAFAL